MGLRGALQRREDRTAEANTQWGWEGRAWSLGALAEKEQAGPKEGVNAKNKEKNEEQ